MNYKSIPPVVFVLIISFLYSDANWSNENHSLVSEDIELTTIDEYQSDNFSTRVRFIVIHYTSLDWENSLKVLTKPQYAVSSHYLIPESKDKSYPEDNLLVYQLVNENDRAWHAGDSQWEQRTNINDQSIGIELVNTSECFYEDQNKNLDYSSNYICSFYDYDPLQIKLLIKLLKQIIDENEEIKPTYIFGHSDIAPERKSDPGPKFPWQLLYQNGVGAWYDNSTLDRYWREFNNNKTPSIQQVQCGLKRYGYNIDITSTMDKQSFYVIRAFQQHFRPWKSDGVADIGTTATLWSLLEKYFPESLDKDMNIICPND